MMDWWPSGAERRAWLDRQDEAARIRQAINDNPRLRNLIQFNAVAGGIGLTAAAISEPQEQY